MLDAERLGCVVRQRLKRAKRSYTMIKRLSWNDYVRLCLSYAEFTQNEDEGWTVEVRPLPGCVTWGETRAEAALMAEDAIHGWLVLALHFGDPIPVIDNYTLAYLELTELTPEIAHA
jgi:predicted RNase H-like HicB family nuclease